VKVIYKSTIIVLSGLMAGQAHSQDNDPLSGRYQAFPGSEIRDTTEGMEDPGIWLLDTQTGRLAFCQSGLINMIETDEGYKIGTPRVSCTPWKFPVSDIDPSE